MKRYRFLQCLRCEWIEKALRLGEDWSRPWGPESEAELGLALLGGLSALNSELGEEEHSREVRMPAHDILPG